LAIAGQGNFGMKTSRFSEQQIAFILKQAEAPENLLSVLV
jgi:hypothetical protein